MIPEKQLAGFIAKFSPDIARKTHDALARMRKRLPGAFELVYDNYNALAIGFSPTERASDAIFSIAVFPRWISLFFLQSGANLPDPLKLLKGSGRKARHIVLENPAMLDAAGVKALMQAALEQASTPLGSKQPRRIVIKAISAKQRPRRPG